MTANGRNLAWDGSANARDLGGLGRLRTGVLVRMEAPTHLTEAGWTALWDFGVRTIVDLRHPDECDPDTAPRPPALTMVRAPLDPVAGTPFHERWQKIDNLATPLYLPALLAEHPELVVAAVRAVAHAAPGGVAFHCASGKDRTGLMALVLLALAGATAQEIVADYVLTFDRMKPVYDALGIRDQRTAVGELLARHDTTIEASLTSTIEALDVRGYLLKNGLTDTELTGLLARLTGSQPS
jgi:hypothetical protein